jgi:glutamate-1-semialdehyde aminotransferase
MSEVDLEPSLRAAGARPRSWRASADHLEQAFAVTASRRSDLDGRFPCVLASGDGAYVQDLDGNRYLDLTSATGGIILGYRDPEVDGAVVACLTEAGNLFHTGSSPRRLALAHRLLQYFPAGERVLFFKTGSCATSAAARLAQLCTGRHRVLSSGYHGWHDWHLEMFPDYKLYDTHCTDFRNDLATLEQALADRGGEVACVFMTPDPNFFDRSHYRRAEQLARAAGARFLLDEAVTGIRCGPGGYAAHAGLTPDAVVVSKGVANGYSLAAVIGSAELLAMQDRTHIWGSFNHEQLHLAAALATLDALAGRDVVPRLHAAGEQLVAGCNRLFREHAVRGAAFGWPPAFHVVVDPALEPVLQASLLQHGLFVDLGDTLMLNERSAGRVDEILVRFDRAIRVAIAATPGWVPFQGDRERLREQSRRSRGSVEFEGALPASGGADPV